MVTQPTGRTLQRLAEDAWERLGDSQQLIFEGTCWGGLKLGERARRLSAGLRRAGLQTGDRVVVCMSNCPEVGITYQAVWRAGGLVTPVLFLLSEDELRHVLTDSGAVLAVTTPEFLPKVAAAAQGLPLKGIAVVGGAEGFLDFAELEGGDEGDLVDADPAGPCALLYTGGTTGRAKGVVLSHDALSSSSWAAVDGQLDDDEDLPPLLLPLPLSHVYGMMVNIAGVHTPRGRISVLMRWFEPVAFLDLVQEHRVGGAAVVPSMLQLLLQQPLENWDLTSLERIGSGGAPLPLEVADEFRRRVPGVEIGEGYGCTETAAIISTTPTGAGRPGSVGTPAPGVSVRIELVDGGSAPPGADGEICVRGPGVMTGYWHAEAETAHALRDGWFHTGDVGHLDADGYLYVVDRIKDLVIRGGFNVYPRDVEEVMLTHPAVIGAAVVGRPDPTYGEEVVAFVKLRPGEEVSGAELVDFAKEHLSAAKYPREIRVVDEIPLTSVGKIDRKRLRSTVR